jgi:choline dehydrogenase-like flavoprotein
VPASRLSQDPNVRVALVEAGGPDDAAEINMPVAFPQLFKTKYGTNPESSSADYFAKANPTGFELADVGYSKPQTSFVQEPVACEQPVRTPLRLRFAN